jgi:hypothetical protein
MRVAVDLRDLERLTREGVDEMGLAPRLMENALKDAAREERQTHTYQNQTGHLEQSTKAGIVSEVANELVIDLEMGEPYASFVIARGYSRFPQIAEKIQRRIAREFAAAERRIGRR